MSRRRRGKKKKKKDSGRIFVELVSQASDLSEQDQHTNCVRLCNKIISRFPVAVPTVPASVRCSPWTIRGESYQFLGQYASAIIDFEKSLEIYERDAMMWRKLGACYQKVNRHSKAIDAFSKSLQYENHPLAHSGLAESYHLMGDFERNLSECDKSLALDPTHVDGLMWRGMALMSLDRKAEAVSMYTKALQQTLRHGNEPIAYLNRGLSYMGIHQYDRAILDFDRCIALVPTDPNPYVNRGSCRLKTNDELAMMDFNRALELDPNHQIALENRGLLRCRLDQKHAALEDLEKVVLSEMRDTDSVVELLLTRAFIYTDLRRRLDAFRDVDQAIRLDPENSTCYFCRAQAYVRFADRPKALENYIRAVELDPNDWRVRFSLARCLYFSERFEEALSEYNRVIETTQSDGDVFLDRGTVLQDLERDEEACADFTRAIQLDPTLHRAYANRATSLLKCDQGLLEDAIEDCNRAIALKPDYILAYHNRSHMLLLRGDPEAAAADVRRMEELSESSPMVVQFAPDSMVKRDAGQIFRETNRRSKRGSSFGSLPSILPPPSSSVADALVPYVSVRKCSAEDCDATQGTDGGKLLRCGGCREARYCSTACQRIDWRLRHRRECSKKHLKDRRRKTRN